MEFEDTASTKKIDMVMQTAKNAKEAKKKKKQQKEAYEDAQDAKDAQDAEDDGNVEVNEEGKIEIAEDDHCVGVL